MKILIIICLFITTSIYGAETNGQFLVFAPDIIFTTNGVHCGQPVYVSDKDIEPLGKVYIWWDSIKYWYASDSNMNVTFYWALTEDNPTNGVFSTFSGKFNDTFSKVIR